MKGEIVPLPYTVRGELLSNSRRTVFDPCPTCNNPTLALLILAQPQVIFQNLVFQSPLFQTT